MLSDSDKQTLMDCADTIDSGLMRVSEAISDPRELAEAIRFAGERVEHGLCVLANAILKHLPE